MSIVAGADFGTLSVRVTLLDSKRGSFGTMSASYPLHRRQEDPDFAIQAHEEAIARRAGTDVKLLSKGLEDDVAGQTGLLRLSWDHGDRTVLVRSDLGGVTLGWNLVTTAQEELFAAIEGTAFHTRIVLERLAEYGVPVERVINAGGAVVPVLTGHFADRVGIHRALILPMICYLFIIDDGLHGYRIQPGGLQSRLEATNSTPISSSRRT